MREILLQLQKSRIALPLIGVVLIFLFYWPVVDNEFFVDDESFVNDWPSITRIESTWVKMFLGDVPKGQEGVYRPLRNIAWGMIYRWAGENTSKYHMVSISAHAMISLLVYALGLKFTNKKCLGFLGQLVFGLHPVSIESVAWISASLDAMAILWALLAWWFLEKFLGEKKKRWYWGMIMCLGIGIFWFELLMLFPLVMVFYLSFYKKLDRKMIWSWMKPVIFLWIGYLILRFGIGETMVRGKYIKGSIFVTMVVMVWVFFKYMWLLMLPIKLSFNHKVLEDLNNLYHHDQTGGEINILNVEWMILGMSTLVLAIGIWWFLKNRNRLGLMGVFLVWIGLSLVPVMQIVPIGSLMSERYLYLSLAGFSLLIVVTVAKLVEIKKGRLAQVLAVGFLGLYLSVGTVRLGLWNNPRSFWAETLKDDPESVFVLNHLAKSLEEAGEIDAAIEATRQSLGLKPNSVGFYNLAVLLIGRDNFSEALESVEKAVSVKKSYYQAWVLKGDLHRKLGNMDSAEESYKKAIEVNQVRKDAYVQLFLMYQDEGLRDLAEEVTRLYRRNNSTRLFESRRRSG